MADPNANVEMRGRPLFFLKRLLSGILQVDAKGREMVGNVSEMLRMPRLKHSTKKITIGLQNDYWSSGDTAVTE